ncbi:7TM diverse intracellular signaling domain-containing protein [Pseudobacteriovorax antillogorgiicola]|uniref:histidine kinase n=1 Tax=Pseudobacteriovorax antillogorgiicola TaxID=1513793 RepID=A0A1Y6BAC9_9BACT|nr:7TM diverse intracellular signaling domain-containing protein [Pseudobacteriovorax antillogorgiicola]TCS57540.1 histidine kinase/DNA gyrase B/HSP90-like ATPase [Pseudobacteriovorax antillogorgiicola]SME99919.1 Histidine kinase-, DNA gyrase B-, and HSP90-like ATPase [Pseudobacteriovorax antillogorgiicola]
MPPIYRVMLSILAISYLFRTNWAVAQSHNVVKGVADLRSSDFSDGKVIPLSGQWEFYWQQLVPGVAVDDLSDIDSKDFIEVPGSWGRSDQRSTYGYGTYRIRVDLDKIQTLAIRWPTIYSSARIFIDDLKILDIGKVADKPDQHIMQLSERAISFQPENPSFYLTIQVTNYDMFLAGLAKATIEIGSPEVIFAKNEKITASTMFLIGCLFMMGIYHFCLFALRRKSKSAAYFGASCLLIAAYTLVARGRPIIVFLPHITSKEQIFLFNLWLLSIPSFLYFTNEIIPRSIPRRFIQSVAWFKGVYLASIFVLETKVFLNLSVIAQVVALISMIFIFKASIKGVFQRIEGARLFLMGLLVLLISTVNDMALARALIQSIPLGATGLFAFIFCQSFLLAKRFSNAFTRVSRSERKIRQLSGDLKSERDHVIQLNETLEQRVEEQTRDIRSFMTNLEMGIFAIQGDSLEIHGDISDHMKVLFDAESFEGVNICSLLFEQSHLDSNEQNLAKNVLVAAMGEDLLAFETNSHGLPYEVERQNKNGESQILELSWNPIVNDDDIVNKILVTVRDVTLIRSLEEEALTKEEDLQFIGELLNIDPAKFRRFIDDCYEFVSENRKLINSKSIQEKDMEALKVLFINMHTMKGAARSLYLKKMTQVFHETEQYYATLQTDANIEWSIDKMNSDLDEVVDIIRSYENLSKNKLGRDFDGEPHIEFSESEVEKMLHLMTRFENEEPISLGNDHLSLHKTIFERLYLRRQQVIAESCQVLPALAKDLGKNNPRLMIEDNEIYMNSVGEDILRKVFVHILRNSMDHGIEPPDVRSAIGKDPVGNISIRMTWETSKVTISYRDDGAGLDLQKISKMAIHRGVLSEDNAGTPYQVAQCIFNAGFSTAKQVNDISGRGVGMGAIKKFIEDAEGTIEISLDQPIAGRQNRSFAFLIELPQNLFARYKDFKGQQNVA